MYPSLLVPLNRSSFAEHALPLALSIARRANARLDLVEVHALYALEDRTAGWVPFEPERDAERKRQERLYLDATAKWLTSMSPVSATAGVLSGSAVLPSFFGGKCAMTFQGNYQGQGMISQSPKGFNWAMFPPLKGDTQDQAANPQTLSISQQSQHKAEAMQFIAYVLNSQNMAKLAAGDWLIPAAPSAGTLVVKSTKHYGFWRNAIAAVPVFVKANWVSLVPYARWKAEVATPSFRQYLSNQISLDDLIKQLTDGWNSIRG